jgi:carbonic anhydrase
MTNFPKKLLNGYRTFKDGRFAQEKPLYGSLAQQGQTPETMIIACCDSRAAPDIIFGSRPGEIFVVRNVANLVPPYEPDDTYHSTSAALEFAVQSLRVKNIVVLGHGRCGGIKAALNPASEPLSPGDFIGKWMDLILPAISAITAQDLSPQEKQLELERAAVRHSLDNLRTFPCVKILEDRNRLTLHGAWFDISDGDLWVMDSETGQFVPMS